MAKTSPWTQSWQYLKSRHFTDIPLHAVGSYQIGCLPPKAQQRAGKVVQVTLVYIGEGKIRKRLQGFSRGIQPDCSAAWFHQGASNYLDLELDQMYEPSDLVFRYAICADKQAAVQLERSLLRRYLTQYGSLPPCNRNFGKRWRLTMPEPRRRLDPRKTITMAQIQRERDRQARRRLERLKQPQWSIDRNAQLLEGIFERRERINRGVTF